MVCSAIGSKACLGLDCTQHEFEKIEDIKVLLPVGCKSSENHQIV